MNKNELPQRKSPRLQGYDYASSGAYFVTICTYQRENLFGEIIGGEMCLNANGDFAKQCWLQLPKYFQAVELDAFVVMPNHMHGIISLKEDEKRTTLGNVINHYKGSATHRVRQINPYFPVVWQPRYHDHIIRNQQDYERIYAYVLSNPERWQEDKFYNRR